MSNPTPQPDQPDRDDLVLLRARYIELLKTLKRTADHNPETLEALQKILPEVQAEASSSQQTSPTVQPAPGERERKHHAA